MSIIFFQKRSVLNNSRFLKTITNRFYKNDRFLKRLLFLFLKFKTSESFLKTSGFFSKTKRAFLETIEKRNQKISFNDRFQKRLTTLYDLQSPRNHLRNVSKPLSVLKLTKQKIEVVISIIIDYHVEIFLEKGLETIFRGLYSKMDAF